MLWLMIFSLNLFAEEPKVVISAGGEEIEMTKREVKKLFTRQELKWQDEDLEVVLPLMDSPEMLWLSRNVLGLPPEVYHRYLLEKAYRAGEDPPKFVATPTLIKGEMVITVLDREAKPGEELTVIRVR